MNSKIYLKMFCFSVLTFLIVNAGFKTLNTAISIIENKMEIQKAL